VALMGAAMRYVPPRLSRTEARVRIPADTHRKHLGHLPGLMQLSHPPPIRIAERSQQFYGRRAKSRRYLKPW
jgi:hypothetical protein